MPACLLSTCLLLVALADPALSQHAHSAPDGPPQGNGLTEPGQSAFAALSEVVQRLEADPATDWSAVELDALRAHLVDMDLVATGAQATVTKIAGGIRAVATGNGPVLGALRRMVPAHVVQLRQDHSWTVVSAERDDAIILEVTSRDPKVTARIEGLGFFGLMASQDHHRAHHLAIATGKKSAGH